MEGSNFMKLISKIFAFFMASLLVLSGLSAGLSQPVHADGPAAFFSADQLQPIPPDELGTNPQLLSSDNHGVSFRIEVPWQQLNLESVTLEGKDYLRVLLPGWSETITPGMPALPITVEKLGVPFGASVTVSVVPGEAHTLKISAPVQPVATQQVAIASPDDLAELPAFRKIS